MFLMKLSNHSTEQVTLELQQLSRMEMLNLSHEAAGKLTISTSKLVEQDSSTSTRKISYKKKAELRAAFYWLNMYQPQDQSDDKTDHLEICKGFLEAFHHLCQISAFAEARKILFISLQLPNTEVLHEQLGIWGHYQEQIELYKKLLHKQDQEFDCFLLNGLGEAHYNLGQFHLAIQAHEQQLALARETQNLQAEVKALGGLGQTYNWSSFLQAKKAKSYFHQQLKLAKEIDDLQQQALALLGLANNCFIENPKHSIKLCMKASKISRDIGNRKLTSKISLALADTYSLLSKSSLALPVLLEQLEISQNIGNRENEMSALLFLSHSYIVVGEHKKAITRINEALDLSQTIGNLFRECDILHSLGAIYCRLENYEKALDCLQKCIYITEQIGEKNIRCFAYANVCYCYTSLSDFPQAKSSYEKGIKLARELNRERTIASLEIIWANTLWQQGKCIQALILAIKSLIILKPWQIEDARFLFRKAVVLVQDFLFGIWQGLINR